MIARRAAAWLCALALAGCASIPLSTMWQLRSFGAEELAAIDPGQLRVATRLEPGNLRVDPSRSKLTLTLHRKDGSDEAHAFGLRTARVQGGPILPAREPGWEVFELDDAGRAALRRLKPRLADVRAHYSGATFNVDMKFGRMPEGAEELRFSVRLQLADAQSPFTLFDRARVPMARGD